MFVDEKILTTDNAHAYAHAEIIIGVYHFLSQLEWFHMVMTTFLCRDTLKKIKDTESLKKYAVIFGERNLIEYEFIDTYSIDEIRDLFSSCYASHTTLYLIGKDLIYMFDPDESDEEIDSIDALSYMFDIEKLNIEFHNPIQSVTDDQYCVFHCIMFVLKLIDVLSDRISQKNLIKFINYVDKSNVNTTIYDIRYFISNLYSTAKLYEEIKTDR
jgi:hypothetical protein